MYKFLHPSLIKTYQLRYGLTIIDFELRVCVRDDTGKKRNLLLSRRSSTAFASDPLQLPRSSAAARRTPGDFMTLEMGNDHKRIHSDDIGCNLDRIEMLAIILDLVEIPTLKTIGNNTQTWHGGQMPGESVHRCGFQMVNSIVSATQIESICVSDKRIVTAFTEMHSYCSQVICGYHKVQIRSRTKQFYLVLRIPVFSLSFHTRNIDVCHPLMFRQCRLFSISPNEAGRDTKKLKLKRVVSRTKLERMSTSRGDKYSIGSPDKLMLSKIGTIPQKRLHKWTYLLI